MMTDKELKSRFHIDETNLKEYTDDCFHSCMGALAILLVSFFLALLGLIIIF